MKIKPEGRIYTQNTNTIAHDKLYNNMYNYIKMKKGQTSIPCSFYSLLFKKTPISIIKQQRSSMPKRVISTLISFNNKRRLVTFKNKLF